MYILITRQTNCTSFDEGPKDHGAR